MVRRKALIAVIRPESVFRDVFRFAPCFGTRMWPLRSERGKMLIAQMAACDFYTLALDLVTPYLLKTDRHRGEVSRTHWTAIMGFLIMLSWVLADIRQLPSQEICAYWVGVGACPTLSLIVIKTATKTQETGEKTKTGRCKT